MAFARANSDHPARVFSAWESARQTAMERAALNRNLATVSGRGDRAKHAESDILQAIRQGLSRLSVSAEVEGVESGDRADWQSMYSGALQALGIAPKQQGQYQLILTVNEAPIERQQRWFWWRGGVDITLQSDDAVLAKSSHSFKASATERHVVEQRAREKLLDQLPQAIYATLTSVHSESAN